MQYVNVCQQSTLYEQQYEAAVNGGLRQSDEAGVPHRAPAQARHARQL